MPRLLISTSLLYPSRLGGPANTIYWLAKALVVSGNQVSIVTTNKHIEQGNVEVDTWTNVDNVRVRYCKSGPLCYFKELYHTCKELPKYDTVMLCDMFQRQVLPVAILAKIHKKRIIWSPRGELYAPALAGSRIKRYYVRLVRKLFGNYATFHATSDEERCLIYEYVGDNTKVVVIPNYMEIPQEQERVQENIPYFLYVGRVNRIKALDRLILGLSQSKLFKQKDYVLKIAGPNQDDYQQELEKLIKQHGLMGRVEFVGNVFGKDKLQLYANAYFSCLLSHSENFGNVVIEALSQGTPVVASTGTPWQELKEKNAGFWIENSPERIADCIDTILKMTEPEYLDMRHNALELAKTYDVLKNIGRWNETLANL